VQKTSVKQILCACTEFNFTRHPDLFALLSKRSRTVAPSLLIEEFLGAMKNSKYCRSTAKIRRPEASMATGLVRKVASLKHRYKEIPCDTALLTRSDHLDKKTFREDPAERSMAVASIASTTQNASWWSPAPEQITRRAQTSSSCEMFGLISMTSDTRR